MLKLTDVSQTARFAASRYILVSVMLPKTNNTAVYRDEKRMVVLSKKMFKVAGLSKVKLKYTQQS